MHNFKLFAINLLFSFFSHCKIIIMFRFLLFKFFTKLSPPFPHFRKFFAISFQILKIINNAIIIIYIINVNADKIYLSKTILSLNISLNYFNYLKKYIKNIKFKFFNCLDKIIKKIFYSHIKSKIFF